MLQRWNPLLFGSCSWSSARGGGCRAVGAHFAVVDKAGETSVVCADCVGVQSRFLFVADLWCFCSDAPWVLDGSEAFCSCRFPLARAVFHQRSAHTSRAASLRVGGLCTMAGRIVVLRMDARRVFCSRDFPLLLPLGTPMASFRQNVVFKLKKLTCCLGAPFKPVE